MKERLKRAFTLAEVLITLMVIGVVAVLTIPAFMSNINENAMAKQRDVFTKKFTEGLRQMRVDGKLNQKYERTQDFVNEMKNYFKLNGTCDSTNLNGCFPAKSITGTTNEDIFDINSSFTPSSIDSESYANYDNFVAVNFADGVSVLLSVNKECIGPAEGDTEGSVTTCLAYVADINGSKAPNKQGKDIVTNMSLSKAAGHAFGLSFTIINNTSYAPGACATGTNGQQACFNAIDGTTYDPPCTGYSGCTTDYWAGAREFCKKLGGDLPDEGQLEAIAIAIYGEDANDGSGVYNVSSSVSDNSLFQQLARGSDYFYLWPREHGSDSYTRIFNPNNSEYYYCSHDYSRPMALCVK